MNEATAYQTDLTSRFWDYKETAFRDEGRLFDRPKRDQRRPPVFKLECADRNILLPAGAPKAQVQQILSAIMDTGRHCCPSHPPYAREGRTVESERCYRSAIEEDDAA